MYVRRKIKRQRQTVEQVRERGSYTVRVEMIAYLNNVQTQKNGGYFYDVKTTQEWKKEERFA